MVPSRRIPARAPILAAAAALLGLGIPGAARAELVTALAPAYFAPGTGGPDGAGDGWAALAAAASKIPVVAVMNPASGPGSVDQVNAYQAAAANLQAHGGQVLGYIPTGGGTVAFDTIKSEIGTYLSSNVHVNGFFLDEVNTPISLGYYQKISGYIKGLNPSYQIVGNPGTPFLNGVAPADFLSVADRMVIFEGPNTAPAPGAPGFNDYPYGLSWWTQGTVPSGKIANIVFDVPTAAAMQADLLKAVGLNAGAVYFTNDTLPNPYDILPSYWDQEVAAIAALNATAVPEPSSLAMALSIAGLCGLRALALRRRLASPSGGEIG